MHRSLLWACAVLILLASVAGFVTGRGWRNTEQQDSPAPDLPITAEQHAAALRLVDEAVTARHEDRIHRAVNAIAEARRLAPDLPGLDIFVGEIAWEHRDAVTLRRAALEALDRGHNDSAAKLLLALGKWITHSGQDTAILGASVRQLLGEAEEASFSNAAPFFFHGEVSRLLADGEEAHRKLLGALHRHTPWASASLLEIKMQLAAAAAADLGRPAVAPVPTDAASAFLRLRNSLLAAGDLREPLVNWLTVSPAFQTDVLLQDQAKTTAEPTADLQKVRDQSQPAVPHGDALRAKIF